MFCSALGRSPWPTPVPNWLYRLAWSLRRFDTDLTTGPLQLLQHVFSTLHLDRRRWPLNRPQQWAATALCVLLAGLPFTPLADSIEHLIAELLTTEPALAAALMLACFSVSVVLIRVVFVKILSARRFWSFHDGHHALKALERMKATSRKPVRLPLSWRLDF